MKCFYDLSRLPIFDPIEQGPDNSEAGRHYPGGISRMYPVPQDFNH